MRISILALVAPLAFSGCGSDNANQSQINDAWAACRFGAQSEPAHSACVSRHIQAYRQGDEQTDYEDAAALGVLGIWPPSYNQARAPISTNCALSRGMANCLSY